jgi:DNA-binding MarR family transcriptional regulator
LSTIFWYIFLVAKEELSKVHLRAWVALLKAQNRLFKALEYEMRNHDVIGIDAYDALLPLEDAPQQRLRMTDLAQTMLLTRGGITKLVDRLERDGLVCRSACPSDRRVTYVVLTEKGLAERIRAWEVYRPAIARHFAGRLSPEDAETLAGLLERYVSA